MSNPPQPERIVDPPLSQSPADPERTKPYEVAAGTGAWAGKPADVVVADQYPIEGEIARGGMGAVLKARDTVLGREIAVKVLLETHAENGDLVQRFIEEARIAGQLQHPGITPVYELGQPANRRPYFTMKLVKGATLAALLAARKDVTEERARFLGIFEQVCQTLAYAHARGVIHRDLKPLNVMVGSFGEVQVMDWGLAKVLPPDAPDRPPSPRPETRILRAARGDGAGADGLDTQTGWVLGTPAYMAPEQARGEIARLDERADVFGLGAMLCEILTGQPPFSGRSAEAMRLAQAGQVEEALTRLDRSDADAELIGLARRCLAAELGDRPRDAGQVAAAMTAHLHSVADRLRRAELERAAAEARATAERRARRLTLSLGALAILFLLAVGGAAGWFVRQRAVLERDVTQALDKATDQQQQADWPAARETLQRAEGLIGRGGSEPMRRRIEQARANLDLVVKLEEIRLRKTTRMDRAGHLDLTAPSAEYLAAFQDHGFDLTTDAPEAIAANLAASAIRPSLLNALDDWLIYEPDAALQARLMAIVRGADPDTGRNEWREVVLRKDPERIKQMLAHTDLPTLSPTWLAILGRSLTSEEAVSLLTKAQRLYPRDFWLNFDLAIYLRRLRPPRLLEALGFHRAALALRPDTSAVHNYIGIILLELRRSDEAIAYLEKACALDPNSAAPHATFAYILWQKGDNEAALSHARRAIALKPDSAGICNTLGLVLLDRGKAADAAEAFRQSIELDPKYPYAPYNLGRALATQGQWPEAAAAYEKAFALRLQQPYAHVNYGDALLRLGRIAEAHAQFKRGYELVPANHKGRSHAVEMLRRVEALRKKTPEKPK